MLRRWKWDSQSSSQPNQQRNQFPDFLHETDIRHFLASLYPQVISLLRE